MSESELTVQKQNSLEVKVDGKKYIYSLDSVPDYKDPLVQKEVKSVLGQLSLKDVTENLYLSVELFYVAYNGVAGARGGTIQAEIAELQSKLAMLCNECVKTMTTFDAETKNIITELIQTYKWLTKGKEALAIKKLAHCSESSMSMSKSANALAEQFKKLQVESTKTRSNTIEEEASERDRKLAAEKAEREIIAKQKAEQTNKEELVAQIAETQQLYDEAKRREEKESDKALILGITSAITSTIGAGLGTFAAMKNPVGSVMASVASASNSNSNNTQLTEAQKNADEKKKLSDQAQQDLLKAKDEQTAKQNTVDKLNSELEALKQEISKKEQDSSTKKDDLDELKGKRDAKQLELDTANQELTTAKNKVQTLEKSAKDYTAAYGAAGVALQDLAKSTGQMAQAAASAEESIHQEKMKYLNQKLALEKEKRESLVKLAEYAENIKNLKVEEGNATLSVNSLHAAVEALGKIIGTLTNASLFWDQMSAYCERMSNQGFQQDIKDLTAPDSGLSEEERIDEYRNPSFMMQFLTYLCQWVAVNGISGEYLISASEAQKKAVEYISQSPTIEEAIKKAPELAKNLEKIIGESLRESRQASAELEQQKAVIETQTGSSQA
jgi:hypothetical protein